MTDRSAPRAPQLSRSSALYAETLALLRDGVRPPDVIRELARREIAPAAMAEALRYALQTLDLEHAGDRAPDLLREIGHRVRSDHEPGAIVRTAVARGLSATTAERLTASARAAWHRRRARVRQTRVGWAVSAVLLLLVQSQLARQPAPTMTAVPQQATVVATMLPMPNAVVLAQRLNVRSGPHKHDPLLTALSANDPLVVISRTARAGRYQVLLPDSRQGWVRAEGVRIDVPLETIPLFSSPPD